MVSVMSHEIIQPVELFNQSGVFGQDNRGTLDDFLQAFEAISPEGREAQGAPGGVRVGSAKMKKHRITFCHVTWLAVQLSKLRSA